MQVDRQRIAMKAVIVSNGKVLILKEAPTGDENTNVGLFHFPGGRVEAGEPYEEALKREVREETGLQVHPGSPLYLGEWWPEIKGQKNQIIAVFVYCELIGDSNITLSEEHDEYIWADPAKKNDYNLMSPDGLVFDAAYKKILSDIVS